MRTAVPSARPVAARRPAPVELVAAAGAAALVTALVLSPEHVEDGPVLCPFRAVTGLPCPGCGLTRSWVYLVHGWWAESWAAHPFGVVTVLVALGLVVAVLLARVRRRAAPDLDRLVRHPLVVGGLLVWAVWAAVRLAVAVGDAGSSWTGAGPG